MYKYHIPVPNRQKKLLKKYDGGHDEVANLLFLKEESLGLKELKSDIRNGAAFLNRIPAYVKEETGQNIIFIHAEDEESGLIALNWLEICLREKERSSAVSGNGNGQEDDDSDIFWGYDEEPWEYIATDPRIVPIIEYRDLLNQYREGNRESGFAGSTALHFARAQESKNPYWLHCTENCICIRMDFYDMPNLTEEYLDVFGDNKRIYVLKLDLWMNEESGTGHEPGDFEMPFGTTNNMGSDNCLKRSLVMCMAGYVRSSVSKEERLRYYSILFKQSVFECGLRIERDFNSEKLTGYLIEQADGTMGVFCSDYIRKAVVYASRRKKGLKTLTEEDFHYLYTDADAKGDGKAVGWKRLDEELIGLDGVKEHVRSIVNNLLYERLRREKGLSTLGYHNVFMMLGAPGTAKTTIAEILGDILQEERLLKGNRFISINGAELKGKFVGWTTEKVKQIFATYDIIFIDEAYSLVSKNGDSDEFSQEALAQLCIELENHAQDRLIIFAGYGGESMGADGNLMKKFLDANPGISSRINSTILFPSYTPDEMVRIFHMQAHIKGIECTHGADEDIKAFFKERVKAQDFGNGREARSLLEGCITKMADRVIGLPKTVSAKALNRLTEEDIRKYLSEIKRISRTLSVKDTNRMRIGFCMEG